MLPLVPWLAVGDPRTLVQSALPEAPQVFPRRALRRRWVYRISRRRRQAQRLIEKQGSEPLGFGPSCCFRPYFPRLSRAFDGNPPYVGDCPPGRGHDHT